VSGKRWRVMAQVGTVDLTNAVRASSNPACRNDTDPKRYLETTVLLDLVGLTTGNACMTVPALYETWGYRRSGTFLTSGALDLNIK
jgi:hypothetical protein